MKNIIDRFKGGERVKKKSIVDQQQDYRTRLAQTLESFRYYGKAGDRLAEVLLKSEKITEDYLSTMGEDEKFGWDEMQEFNSIDRIDLVFKYREKFQGITYPEFIDYLICRGNYRFKDFLEYLDNFKGLNHEDALIRIYNEYRSEYFLKSFIEKGNGFTAKTIEMLIWDNRGGIVADHIDKFKGITHREILDKLIEGGEYRIVAKNLYKFKGISHKEIANKFIEKGEGYILVESLDGFEGLDYQEIANKLIDRGCGCYVVENLEKFPGVSHQEIANKLIERGEGKYLMHYRTKLKGLNEKEFLNRLIERGEADFIDLNKINHKGIDQEIADSLVKTGRLEKLIRNLDNLECMLSGKVADQLSMKGDAIYQVEEVARNVNKFERLNMKWGEMFIQKGYEDIVLQNPEKFGLTKEK